MEQDDASLKINVAITGALTQSRSTVAALINATNNGVFVESITAQTHYLVSTKHDSQKARKAARLGTAVISEGQLRAYLAAGSFEPTALPDIPREWGMNLPTIVWQKKEDPDICLLSYRDAGGQVSTRRILWVSNGRHPRDTSDSWIGGYDGPRFKSWRLDRVLEIEVLGGG